MLRPEHVTQAIPLQCDTSFTMTFPPGSVPASQPKLLWIGGMVGQEKDRLAQLVWVLAGLGMQTAGKLLLTILGMVQLDTVCLASTV